MALLPEWYAQEAIILAWPDAHTDWQPWLTKARQTYLDLIDKINTANCGVILLIRRAEIQAFKSLCANHANVLLVAADYNDTWTRDYAFLTCQTDAGLAPTEFVFNGWGNKFDARKDNNINQSVLADLCSLPLTTVDLVAEGGALEIDERGVLLSTSMCLLNPQRNGALTLEAYKEVFSNTLGATQCHVFSHGHLEGDDTDAHIDTVVRFSPDGFVVVQTAFNRPDDTHFEGLDKLFEEVKHALPEYKVLALPLPYILNDEGDRLPASYANFLINNDQVLCPVYNEPEDATALEIIATAFPSHKIVAVNCRTLVEQFGSLHCITMQVPAGTLRPDIKEKLTQGITEL